MVKLWGVRGEHRSIKKGGEGRGTTAPLTPFAPPFPSSQTLPRENVLPNSSLLSTATRTGELEGGSERETDTETWEERGCSSPGRSFLKSTE